LTVTLACGSSPNPKPKIGCQDASDCTQLQPCQVLDGVACNNGTCQFQAKRCDTPPDPQCIDNDSVYRVYSTRGTCQSDGGCIYPFTDIPCARCAAVCLTTCIGMSCQDTQSGCRTSGHCEPGSPPTCLYDPAPAGQTCDDADLCTYGDHCDAAGHCTATTVTCASDPGTCGKQRKCNGTATCDEWWPKSDVTCDDGNLSTYADHCDGAGKCVGALVLCPADDPGPCGVKRAPDGTATCAVTYPDANTSCDDGDLSTYADHCNGAGKCLGTLVVCPADDPGPCGAKRTPNGTATCAATYPDANTSCDDGNSCTSSDHCDGKGQCAGKPYVCSALADNCGVTVCDGKGGCPRRVDSADGTACGTQPSCTSCNSGVCAAGCYGGLTCKQVAQGTSLCR
jgi:hypothetical protein